VISPTLQNVLLAFNRPKTITATMTLGGVVNIILAIWLVQQLGAIGPAIALVLGRFLVLALLFLVLSADDFGFRYGKFALVSVIAIVLFTGAWLPDSVIMKSILYVAALAIYGFIMMRFVMAEETTILLALIRKHRYDWRTLLTSS